MGILTISTRTNIRNTQVLLPDTSFAYTVASQPTEEMLVSKGGTSPVLKRIANNPDWALEPQTGFTHYFRKHNGFRDQELHDRIILDQYDRLAHAANYYTTTYDTSSDPIWHEDNNRTIDRVFEIRIMMDIQKEDEVYSLLGIKGLDELDAHIHMTSFLRQNYQNLMEMGITPMTDTSEHNPILYQRGYEEFNYHGYKACQIIPKAGDLIKLEAYDKLYKIEAITDADPGVQHRYRKYFWKVSMREYRDDAKSISTDVAESPLNQNFINDLFGTAGVFTEDNEGETLTGSQFESSGSVDEAKLDDIVQRPTQVPEEVEDPTQDPRFYPGFDNYGGW